MELNREQIIKALECCHILGKDCLSCPFENDASNCICLEQNALDLITSQEQRIKELTENIVGLLSQVDCDKAEINLLRKHIEILGTTIENQEQEVYSIKSDTVRKMQERLKPYEYRLSCHFCKHSLRGNRNEKCDEELRCGGWNKWESVIDQTATEILEENK